MKKTAILFLATLLMTATMLLSLAPGTTARIIDEKKGDIWMLDKGLSSGVQKGMEGFLMKKLFSQKTKKMVSKRIAHFKVSRVQQKFCYAEVDKWEPRFSSPDAQWAEFSGKLTPPAPKAGKKITTPTPIANLQPKKVEKGKTQRWYLDKGDTLFSQKKYDEALTYYNRVLEKDPDDPGAKSRIQVARGYYFVQQGDLELQHQEPLSAYEYYIEAFSKLGDKDYIAAEKIIHLWDLQEGFYGKMEANEYHLKPVDILQSLLRYSIILVEENKPQQLAALAVKIKKYARDNTIKNRIDTLAAAKEIQTDIDNGDFTQILSLVDAAIEENNLYKASYIIQRLENLALDDNTRNQLAQRKNTLKAKEAQTRLLQEKALRDEKIMVLEEEAKGLVTLKKYDEAITRYMEIYKMAPDNPEYGQKIKQLQVEKFKYENFQKELKAKVEMGNHLLHAKDCVSKDLIQDALDYYVKAYNAFPGEEKTIAGIVTVLETCNNNDAGFLTAQLIARKLSKFTKDFLAYMEKTYLNTDDAKGLEVLNKIVFIPPEHKDYKELVLKFKDNLYAINLKLGNETFTKADFPAATQYYDTAKSRKETEEVTHLLAACAECTVIEELIANDKKKEAGQRISALPSNPNKFDILSGLLYLSNKYLDQHQFKTAKFLYKRIDDFHVQSIMKRIQTLKAKEKELKRKLKEEKKERRNS